VAGGRARRSVTSASPEFPIALLDPAISNTSDRRACSAPAYVDFRTIITRRVPRNTEREATTGGNEAPMARVWRDGVFRRSKM
jgi:hypothetical protein